MAEGVEMVDVNNVDVNVDRSPLTSQRSNTKISNVSETEKEFYYDQALLIEKNAKQMNLVLTIIDAVIMFVEAIYGIGVWAAEDCMETILCQFMFIKIVFCLVIIYKWIQNLRIKEASHLLTNLPALMIFFICILPILAVPNPSGTDHLITWIVFTFVVDIVLLIANFIVVAVVRKKAYSVYNNEDLWGRFVSDYARKVLSYLPVADDAQGELAQQEAEDKADEARAAQEEAMRSPKHNDDED